MNIYLAYVTNGPDRMLQAEFDEICSNNFFNLEQMRSWFFNGKWKLDKEFGISLQEAINMSRIRAHKDWENEHHATGTLGG